MPRLEPSPRSRSLWRLPQRADPVRHRRIRDLQVSSDQPLNRKRQSRPSGSDARTHAAARDPRSLRREVSPAGRDFSHSHGAAVLSSRPVLFQTTSVMRLVPKMLLAAAIATAFPPAAYRLAHRVGGLPPSIPYASMPVAARLLDSALAARCLGDHGNPDHRIVPRLAGIGRTHSPWTGERSSPNSARPRVYGVTSRVERRSGVPSPGRPRAAAHDHGASLPRRGTCRPRLFASPTAALEAAPAGSLAAICLRRLPLKRTRRVARSGRTRAHTRPSPASAPEVAS